MFRLSNHWRSVDLRHLEVLQAIAARGSLWGASEVLDCSPSAVSQQLATLERLVGRRLVERSPGRRQVRLTDAGHVLVRHAGAIVARLRAAEADLAALDSGAGGTLRVGTFPSVGMKILPRLVREFAGQWPGVEVRLTEGAGDYGQLLQMVEGGELDLAFTGLPLPAGPFEAVRLMEDPCVLVVPRDARLDSPPSAGQWAELNLIGFCHGPIVAAADQVRRMGVDPRVVFRTDDNGTMQGLVAAGFGAALAPLLTVDESNEAVRVIELEGFPSRLLGLAWHRDRDRSPAAAAFVERARDVCANLDRPRAAALSGVTGASRRGDGLPRPRLGGAWNAGRSVRGDG
jgi:molybdate transport repressor ModE-like protein